MNDVIHSGSGTPPKRSRKSSTTGNSTTSCRSTLASTTAACVTWPSPAAIVAAREGPRLALIASLQYLPPRQRPVLILRDVLDFPTVDIAAFENADAGALERLLVRDASITTRLG